MLHDYLGWELTLENLKPKHSYKNPRGYTCINRSCLGQLLKCKIITHHAVPLIKNLNNDFCQYTLIIKL